MRGGGVIVLPLFHKVGKLKLTARQINVALADAVTRQGIKVAVQGVATFKIGADDESIRNAAERFLEAERRGGRLDRQERPRGLAPVDRRHADRRGAEPRPAEVPAGRPGRRQGDLATSGLQIDSFTIQAIRDESGYMELIGQQETARRERDARMAKAAADQEAAVREAEAEQIKINAARDVSLRRAETETQTAAAQARAAQAGPLAEAEATQEVTRKQTELAELEAARKQKELLTSTVRPAEADAEAQIRRAEGEKGARIAQAQAEAERVKLAGSAEAAVTVTKGEAQARVVSVNAEAEAQRTTLEGNAEAGIMFTKGEAEAKALALRAEAYRQFNEAAIIQTVLSMLPEIVRAAAEPLANIETLTVLSNDGASDVVKNVTRTVTEASATVKGLTGIDIPALLNNALGGTPASERRRAAPPRPSGRGRRRRWLGRRAGPARAVAGSGSGGGAASAAPTPAPRRAPPGPTADRDRRAASSPARPRPPRRGPAPPRFESRPRRCRDGRCRRGDPRRRDHARRPKRRTTRRPARPDLARRGRRPGRSRASPARRPWRRRPSSSPPTCVPSPASSGSGRRAWPISRPAGRDRCARCGGSRGTSSSSATAS